MAVHLSDPTELRGARVTGSQDVTLGRVDDVYLDKASGRAVWAAVEAGTVGGHVVLVPLAAADYRDGVLALPYTTDQLRDAPHHDPRAHISARDERQLLTHFGVSYPGETAEDAPAAGGPADGAAADGAGDGTMTRSEEELHVGTRTVATERVRVRKHVVTEMRTVTVAVSHEELSIEREEITDADRADVPASSRLSAQEHEIILHSERPVVTTEVVATERVRIGTRTVHGQEQVSGPVRKEQIELDRSDSAEQQH